ncbi:MAG: hypothetical protein U1F21_14955 [Sphaerotilus natans]
MRQEAPAERVQDDPQRRERAQLLRDFERSSLKRSSFCVLRGVPEDQLDALLAQARREAAGPGPRASARGAGRAPPWRPRPARRAAEVGRRRHELDGRR